MHMVAVEALESERLFLEPVSVEHAAPMVAVLADSRLYNFTGGEPPSLGELTRRYAAQAPGGPPDGSQVWLNWMVRRRESGELVGFVQATLAMSALVEATLEQAGSTFPVCAVDATIAWIITSTHQRQGLASEAAGMMSDWLRLNSVTRFAAYIHPDNIASRGVARRLGLAPTEIVKDGEVRWSRTVTSRCPHRRAKRRYSR
jgi:RimJ/RimL family protein N-acetyltransferase